MGDAAEEEEGWVNGQMKCSVCGWWPPLVRVREGKTERASDGWRWRQLERHILDVSDAEERDGNADGPHTQLLATVERIRCEEVDG